MTCFPAFSADPYIICQPVYSGCLILTELVTDLDVGVQQLSKLATSGGKNGPVDVKFMISGNHVTVRLASRP